MATIATADGDTVMEDVSPKGDAPTDKATDKSFGTMAVKIPSLEPRADPDAQTTVTDFLDFTEHLPSDIVRSLTLIGKLDQTYTDASNKVDDLTTIWGRLPHLPTEERPLPVQLRADISKQLDSALTSRVLAHAEAVRMSENVNRHYNKAKILLAKLQKMMENYPTEEPKSPVASRSPQMSRTKLATKPGDGASKPKRPQVPTIIVPGEVQAPYDIDYDTYTDDSDVSSDEESDIPATSHRTPAPAPRIKLVSAKPPKTPNRLARPVTYSSAALAEAAAANNAALLQPPPDNAVIGSSDAPWLQLTQYELAKLRKRMKKNATWTPSETMVARELKALGRGPDAYRAEKKEAELAGRAFEPIVPAPVIVNNESGEVQLPAGAISVDTLAAEEVPTSNRGMKLNEAKKLKRDLAKQAAEEAEESARKMTEAAKLFLGSNGDPKASGSEPSKETPAKAGRTRTASRTSKRKRDAEDEEANEAPEKEALPTRPPMKRSKTETPVPPPQRPSISQSKVSSPEISSSEPLATPGEPVVTLVETPVPIPVPPQGPSNSRVAVSPTPSTSNVNIVTTTTSERTTNTETPVPLPMESRKSVTPFVPSVRETTRRQTRGGAAKQARQEQQQQSNQPQAPEEPQDDTARSLRSSSQLQEPQDAVNTSSTLAPEAAYKQPSSRAQTPRTTPNPDGLPARRPSSRGKLSSQEPQPSLAADRPRRASTARNTPAPEPRPPKRTRRPAPGIVSTTGGGRNSAVGKRKAAPRKKARTRRDKGPAEPEEEEDDEDSIDPNEARYCLCNGVSFGTMIQCDNDNCKQEWFHLECVGLSNVPARTTKWYCPECRILLNIGEKGQVSARGVKM